MPEPDAAGPSERQPVAFISHHSSQVEQARHIARILARHGIKGWMAPDDIEPGQAFDQVIIEQIGKCDVILLLFSASSDQSKHVKREVMLAEQHKKLIYPIRLESIQPDGLAYWLQDYQWIDWLDGRDEAIERMVATIRRQLSLPSSAPPAVPAPEPAPPPPAPQAPATPVNQAAHVPPPVQSGNNKFVLVLAVIGAGFLGILLLGMLAMGSESAPDTEPTGFPSADSASLADGGGETGGGTDASGGGALRAGSWQVSYQMTDFTSDFPNADQQQASALVSAYSGTACISAAEAGDPGRTVLAAFITGQPNCTIEPGPTTGGGVLSSAVCSNPQDGTHSEVEAQGSYGPDSASVKYEMTQWFEALGSDQSTEMSVAMMARRLGDC